MKKLPFLMVAAALCTALHAVAQAPAAAFPSRPVTLVVPFTPGSGSDTIARIVGPRLAQRWGQPVVVDNRAGASGNLGASVVAKAAADGHTLLMAINTFTMTPAIYKAMPFDPVADFAPVAKLAEASFTLAVNPSLPVKDMRSLIAYAKANPGRLNYASPGNGTPHHLAMELLKMDQDLNIVHVPYKGISGALTDLMGGQVQMMFGTVPSVRQQAMAGKLRLVGVTGQEHHPLAPEVPTFKEQGIDALESVDAWYAVLAPARTPSPVIERLQRDFVEVMNEPAVKAELLKLGLGVKTSTPYQLSALIKTDLARWKKVVTTANITAD